MDSQFDLLREHGLYGGGLVEVDSPLLVGRYNQCLAEIGEKPTALKKFSIDGRGWSSEIAAEKQNPAYLSHGGAMQYAILLTPDQIGKPVYKPYFSFERAVLAYLFKQAGDAIARITNKTGLWLQIDPGFSQIQQVGDLAMVNSVDVVLEDPEHLVQAAEDQQKLVAQFLSEKDAWTDASLRAKLVASGQAFGDLRFAPSFRVSYQYTDTACFYTPQFGGTFVFRGFPGSKNLLVTGDEKLAEQEQANCKIASFSKQSLLKRFTKMGLIEIPIDWYRKNIRVLEELREGLLVAVIYKDGKSKIDFSQLNKAQCERCAMDYRDKLPPEFSLLERLIKRLENKDSVDVQHLPLSMKWILARPVEGLPIYIMETVAKLICRIAPVRVATQFAYDKEEFFTAFGLWPEAKKQWAVKTLISNGLVPRRHS